MTRTEPTIRRFARLSLSGLLMLVGCVDPVDITTAYENETYLCDDDAAFRARVDACRALRASGGDCSGVASFQGTIDGVDVVVDNELVRAEVFNVRAINSNIYRDAVEVFGNSPYFSYRMAMTGIGGESDRPDGDATETITPSRICERGTSDGLTTFSIRISAASGSQDLPLQSGTIVFSRQTSTEQEARFSGAFANGEMLDGCFVAFIDEATLEDVDCLTP